MTEKMKMSKVALLVACVAVLSLALFGCSQNADKHDGKDASSASSAAASSAAEAVTTTGFDDAKAKAKENGVIVVDDEICTIVAEKAVETPEGPGYPVMLFNNSDKTLLFITAADAFMVGEQVAEPALSATLAPGAYVSDTLVVSGVGAVDALVDVHGTIQLSNADTGEFVISYVFSM